MKGENNFKEIKVPHRWSIWFYLAHFVHIWGHSNNTWHFFGTFLPPPLPMWHFIFLNNCFQRQFGFELWNEIDRKCLLKPNLALKHYYLLTKALKSVFKKAEKVNSTFSNAWFKARTAGFVVDLVIWISRIGLLSLEAFSICYHSKSSAELSEFELIVLYITDGRF